MTDVNGRLIGSTYPKRAKGLVKQGRAEYVDDLTIRLKFTHAPTVINNTEEMKMSKVINFNAREFVLDKSIKGNNVGERVFITTPLGSAEVWEIGDWQWNWSQIVTQMTLQKNTDCILRFAVLGGINNTGDAVSQAVIVALDGYDTSEQAWEERQVYALDKSRYQPVISKSDSSNGLLRVFEIPFNTGEHERYKILFTAMHAKAGFFAPQEYSAYEPLNDLTYNEWWENRLDSLNGQDSRQNGLYLNMSGANISLSAIQKLLSEKPSGTYIDLSDCDVCDDAQDSDGQTEAEDEKVLVYTEKQFAEFLKNIGDGVIMEHKRIIVNSDGSGERYDIGASADGVVIDLSGSILTARAFSMLASKLGDGCIVSINDMTVTDDGIDDMYPCGGKSDGLVIDLSGSTVPQKALDLFYSKGGDGFAVTTDNCKTE